jgi:hypothetical protein
MPAHLDITWEKHYESSALLTAVRVQINPALTRQLSPARQPARCPECKSIVYSRRHKLCGVCGEPLPNFVLFSLEESRRIEAIICNERSRHRQWLQSRE